MERETTALASVAVQARLPATSPERLARRARRARAVLLDLDGTMLDTAPDLIGSLNDLRREEGLPALVPGLLAPVVSHGSAPIIQRGFDIGSEHPQFERLRRRFLERYRQRVADETRAYAGVDELLSELDARRMPWGVVTNKPGWLTRPLLSRLGYIQRVHCLVCGDDTRRRKPHPYPVLEACVRLQRPVSECLLLGDAERDVRSGLAAGTLTVVALYGYITGEDRVAQWGAHALVHNPLEVLHWVHGSAEASG